MASNPRFHERTKHIDVRYHAVRDEIEKGHIRVEYINTRKMVADIHTKSLPRDTHEKHVKAMGLIKLNA